MASCSDSEGIQLTHPREHEIREAMQDLIRTGVPGCALAIHTDEGLWTMAEGLACIESNTPMQACHLQYLQSISKTYMAVAVLKLYEQGKIDLDAPMARYLPEKYNGLIPHAETISVRMLLNHTSGIPEYNFAPAYVSYLLQHPDHVFTADDYLGYVAGEPLDFEPGSRYSYRNTNYVLLALMVDAITGDHARFISENIFAPLGLTQTFYRHEKGYLTYPYIVNTYWDRYSDGILENVSQMQRTNVSTLIGDDGIVTTPADAVLFMTTLMDGRMIKAPTLEQMQSWVKDKEGKPRYGLGLGYHTIQDQVAYGHSGGGIGAGCELHYFPEKDVCIFVAINIGTVTESPLHEAAAKARDRLYAVLLN